MANALFGATWYDPLLNYQAAVNQNPAVPPNTEAVGSYAPGGKVTAVPMMEDFQMNLLKQLGTQGAANAAAYTPGQAYTGQYTAGMTPYESKGLDILNNALTQGTGDLFAAGKGQIMDTLSGRYMTLHNLRISDQ